MLYKMTRKMPWVTLQAKKLLRVSVSGKVSGGFLRNVLANTEENPLDNIFENPSENTWESASEKNYENISRLIHRKIYVPESLF